MHEIDTPREELGISRADRTPQDPKNATPLRVKSITAEESTIGTQSLKHVPVEVACGRLLVLRERSSRINGHCGAQSHAMAGGGGSTQSSLDLTLERTL